MGHRDFLVVLEGSIDFTSSLGDLFKGEVDE